MFCTQCGVPIHDARANFCPSCGEITAEGAGRRDRSHRRLFRSRYDKQVSGVCGGLADYLGADPTVVRLLMVLATLFTGGLALFGYLAAWIIVPQEPILLGEASRSPAPAAS